MPAVGGGKIALGEDDGWRILIVYRGLHCPLCRSYLKTLSEMLNEFEQAEVKVYAISADPLEKAQRETTQEGWRFPIGYELSVAQMRTLGLFVSTPRSLEETDRPFAEPATVVIDDTGRTHMIALSNAAFDRIELPILLQGLKFVRQRNFPIRGPG